MGRGKEAREEGREGVFFRMSKSGLERKGGGLPSYSTPPPPPTTTSVQYRESRGELEEEEKQAPGCDC